MPVQRIDGKYHMPPVYMVFRGVSLSNAVSLQEHYKGSIFTNHGVGYACVSLQNDCDTLAIVFTRNYHYLGVGVLSDLQMASFLDSFFLGRIFTQNCRTSLQVDEISIFVFFLWSYQDWRTG